MPSNLKTESFAILKLLLMTFPTAAIAALIDMGGAIPCTKYSENLDRNGFYPCLQHSNKPDAGSWLMRAFFLLLPSIFMITALSQLHSLRNRKSDDTEEICCGDCNDDCWDDYCAACSPCYQPDKNASNSAMIQSSISYTSTLLLYLTLTITGLILSDRTMPEGNQREELALPRFFRTGLVVCVAMLSTYGVNRTVNAFTRGSTQRWRQRKHERLLDEALALTETEKKSYGTHSPSLP